MREGPQPDVVLSDGVAGPHRGREDADSQSGEEPVMLASCLQLPGCCARYGVRALPLIAWSRSCTDRCKVRHGAASVEVQWQRFPHASARRREPRTGRCTYPVHCWYLVLGNCTSSCVHFSILPPKYRYSKVARPNRTTSGLPLVSCAGCLFRLHPISSPSSTHALPQAPALLPIRCAYVPCRAC